MTGYDCRHCGELALCGRSKNGYGDATDPGVAAVPGAEGVGRDGGVRAPVGVPSVAAGGGTGPGKRPERATARAARAALASARDLGGI